MFNNSKYANVLTIILVIAIISIVGILVIIGYNLYKKYYTDTGAIEAATEFEQSVTASSDANNIKTDLTGIEGTTTNTNSASSSGDKVTKYKGFDVVGTIQIPTIEVKYPILEKVTKKSLETSVALLYTSNGLNEVGNSVIIGHNYRNGTMFSNVKKLQKGNYIYIIDTQGRKVRYKIYNIFRELFSFNGQKSLEKLMENLCRQKLF